MPTRRAKLLTALTLCCTACSDGLRSPTAPLPPGNREPVTFAEIQTTIFDASCALGGCHDAGSAEGGMVLEQGLAYDQIVGVPANGRPDLLRVAPRDPEGSYLLKKIRGDSDIVGSRMPRGRAPLEADRVAALVDWILTGAPRGSS